MIAVAAAGPLVLPEGVTGRFLPMNTDLAAQDAIDRLNKVGFANLSKLDKTLAACWLFDAGVNNTGFARYYAGKRGNLAFHAPLAFKTIGARRLAGIAAQANALFGSAGPSPDRDIRRGQLAALPEAARREFTRLEERYVNSEEDVDDFLETYLNRTVPRK